MSTSDSADSSETRFEPPFEVPSIVSAEAFRLRLRRPRRLMRDGKIESIEVATAVDVVVDRIWPPRGTGPALFVGDQVLVESERIGGDRYRFYGPEDFTWPDDAVPALGVAGTGQPRPGPRAEIMLAPPDHNAPLRQEE